MSSDFWKEIPAEDVMGNGLQLWSLTHFASACTVTELVPNECWIGVREDDGWIDFVVSDFAMADMGHINVKVKPWWRGSGPSGSLRELRHSWFGGFEGGGDDIGQGYVFYLNAKHTRAALDFLERYFDMG